MVATLLLGMVAILLFVQFWRIFLPIALLAAAVLALGQYNLATQASEAATSAARQAAFEQSPARKAECARQAAAAHIDADWFRLSGGCQPVYSEPPVEHHWWQPMPATPRY